VVFWTTPENLHVFLSLAEENAEITLDVSLAYRDDMFNDWEEIAHAIEIRKLKCTFGSPKVRCSGGAGGGEVWGSGGHRSLPFLSGVP